MDMEYVGYLASDQNTNISESLQMLKIQNV